jgi:hypothetical protein
VPPRLSPASWVDAHKHGDGERVRKSVGTELEERHGRTWPCSTLRASPTVPLSQQPQRYAVGMKHVSVNGVQVLKDGEHTGARPGRALWGPGRVK